ncbi:hypothetical protein N7461_009625 [Penicillium sp. DV-2018c]|nr:hypothetical protein N7461_009625 [Penicillium sp. DV-2018c]
MAATVGQDVPDLTGTWVLNRKLSTDPEEVFVLQGVPWVVRKVLRHARLSLQIWQTTTPSETKSTSGTGDSTDGPPDPITTLRVIQTVNPGGFDSEGSYSVDGSTKELSLPIFGDIRTQLKFIKKTDIMEKSIRQALVEASLSEMVIQELAYNASKGWEAEVVWTFEELDGKKYLTRNISTTKGGEKVIAKMVYDGP